MEFFEYLKSEFILPIIKFFPISMLVVTLFYPISKFCGWLVKLMLGITFSIFFFYAGNNVSYELLLLYSVILSILYSIPFYAASSYTSILQQMFVMANSLGLDTRFFDESDSLARLGPVVLMVVFGGGYFNSFILDLQSLALITELKDIGPMLITENIFMSLKESFSLIAKFILVMLILDIFIAIIATYLPNTNINSLSEPARVVCGILLLNCWLYSDILTISLIGV